MNKLFALLRNELTKLRHRKVLIIFAAIMLIWSLIVTVLINSFGMDISEERDSSDSIISEVNRQRNFSESSLRLLETRLNRQDYEADRADYEEYGYLKAEIDKQNWIEKNIETYRSTDHLDSLLSGFYDVKAELYTLEKMPAGEKSFQDTIQQTMLSAAIARLEPAFLEGNMSGLIDLMWQVRKIAAGEDDGAVSRIDKIVSAQQRYMENGADISTAIVFGFDYENALSALETDDSTMPNIAFPSEIVERENTVKVLEKKAQTGISTSSDSFQADLIFRVLTSFSAFFIGILIIVIAGGMISSEISTGSIKSLILAPVRRYKILTAKLFATFIVLIIFTVYSWAINILIIQFINGRTLAGYIGISGGHAYALPPWLYGLVRTCLENVSSLFFMLLAFMLSTVGLGTAGAVGISMGTRFGAVPILNILFLALKPAEWMKYIPFHHLELANRILPIYGGIEQMAARGMAEAFGAGTGAPKTTLTFSFVWIGWLMLLMLITAYDSFLRKDI